MPQIPQYQEQLGVSGGDVGPGPQGDSGAADIAQLGAQLTADAQRRRDAEVTRTVTQHMATLRLAAEQDFINGQQSAADGADGFTPAALKAYDDRRTEIAKGITDQGLRNAFIDYADQNLRPEIATRAMHFEAEQGLGVRVAKANEALDKSVAAVELAPTSWVQTGIEQLRQIDSLGLSPQAREEARIKATDAIRYAAARGFAKADPLASLAKLKTTESGDPAFDQLGARQRLELEQFSKARLAEVTADSVVAAYRTDARAGTKALIALGNSDLPSDVKSSAQSQSREGIGALHAERRLQFNDEVTALERSISQDTPAVNAENTAASLFRRGAYTPEQYTNVVQAIDESRIRAAKAGAEIRTVQEAVISGARLDPKDEKVVKAVDKWFIRATTDNGMQPGSDEWVNSAAELANRTNILPPEAMSWARKTLLSGDPALSVPAANAMQRFADAAPTAYSYFDDPNIKAFAAQVDGMVRAGVVPAKAVEIARSNTYDIPKARQDALQAKWKKEKYTASNPDELHSRMNGDDAFETTFFGKAPAPSIAMQDEYDALVRTYFDHSNGDIDGARNLAWKDLRGTYGVSRINGDPEVLKYAPELVFPGLDPKVVRTDIDTSAKAAGVTTPVRIVPARVTGDTHGLFWNLQTTDANGNLEVVLDAKNRPLIYAIPTDTKRYLEAQQAEQKKAVDEAIAERERRRQTQEAARNMDPLGDETLR